MSRYSPRPLVCLVLVACLSLLVACARTPGVKEKSAAVPDSAASVRVMEGYGKLPLGFEENRGQSAAESFY